MINVEGVGTVGTVGTMGTFFSLVDMYSFGPEISYSPSSTKRDAKNLNYKD